MKTLRLFVSLMVMALSMAANAQTYPDKRIRIIVPAPAGGSADVLARVLSQKLMEVWEQPIIIENRIGDHNNIGTNVAAKSPGDGYTWVLLPDSVVARSPHLGPLPFDIFRDFTPITELATVPFVLVVNPSVPVESVQELVAYAKANPGTLSYGSSGNGSVQHMLSELIKYSAGGFDMLHVPYKGSSQTITDLVAGRIQVMVGAAGQLTPFVKDGRLRLLASAGAARLPDFPSTPTIAEQLPAFGTRMGDPWIGLYMPANVPKDIVAKVNAEVVRVMNSPDVKSSLAAKGFDVVTTTPEAMAAIGREDYASWGRMIRDAGVKIE
ncbi:MAG: tripartite tricarboxylate transporter substrate binding protein [Variovorax sp.]